MNILRNSSVSPGGTTGLDGPLSLDWRVFLGPRPRDSAPSRPIVRLWHGRTPLDLKEEYAGYLERTGVSDLRRTPGNHGVRVLAGQGDDAAHFLVMSWWESEAAIRAFAGTDVYRARYYPEDSRYLLEMTERVHHLQEMVARE